MLRGDFQLQLLLGHAPTKSPTKKIRIQITYLTYLPTYLSIIHDFRQTSLDNPCALIDHFILSIILCSKQLCYPLTLASTDDPPWLSTTHLPVGNGNQYVCMMIVKDELVALE